MDTVSYLTINDETKEIADKVSRSNIENIEAVMAAHGDDINLIQSVTGPNGYLSNSINDAYIAGMTAQTAAQAAVEAAALADEKAESATQAADTAWTQASSATQAAQQAWGKAAEASLSANLAEQKAESATQAADVAWFQADSATQAADQAWNKAEEASEAAALADHKADLASAAADAAQYDARRANSYANGALAGLSTLESVVDTVNWFADHRTPSTDTTVNVDKNYYTFDESTGTMSKVDPWGNENPSEEGWYEIDETIQNYIASHVAETDDGLYVLSTSSGWRVLVSTGGGNYVAGVFIVDPQGVIKQAMTGSGIKFDNTTPFTIGDEDAYIVFDGRGHITLGGTGINILSSVTIGGGSNKTLSQVLDDLGTAITSIEYGVGNSNTSHSDVPVWSSNTPNWEPGKYVWMRTSSNGLNYTYTCIQGAQGPQGETGPKGETGERGADGADGIGIFSVSTSYALSDSEDIVPDEDAWRTSINYWYDIEEMEETGETGWTGEYDYEYIDETEETGETGEEEEPLIIEPGKWLWTRIETVYSDYTSSVVYQKTYIGMDGQPGATGPEGVVTITPRTIDWDTGTAILVAVLRVDGTIITPTTYNWTKGTNTTSLGTDSTLIVDDLNSTYNCTVTW